MIKLSMKQFNDKYPLATVEQKQHHATKRRSLKLSQSKKNSQVIESACESCSSLTLSNIECPKIKDKTIQHKELL